MAVNPQQLPPGQATRHIDDDSDYSYYWSFGDVDVPIPRWLAEILDVPLIVRWELFLFGFCAGLIAAAVAVLIAFFSAS